MRERVPLDFETNPGASAREATLLERIDDLWKAQAQSAEKIVTLEARVLELERVLAMQVGIATSSWTRQSQVEEKRSY